MGEMVGLAKRPLGKTGVEVTILGMGGEGILRTFGQEQETVSLINRAIDLGMTYFESARAYAGSESYYGMALGDAGISFLRASRMNGQRMVRETFRTTLATMKICSHLDDS
jgi:predicted aldo/keto reductase-like oxidoreductase